MFLTNTYLVPLNKILYHTCDFRNSVMTSNSFAGTIATPCVKLKIQRRDISPMYVWLPRNTNIYMTKACVKNQIGKSLTACYLAFAIKYW